MSRAHWSPEIDAQDAKKYQSYHRHDCPASKSELTPEGRKRICRCEALRREEDQRYFRDYRLTRAKLTSS